MLSLILDPTAEFDIFISGTIRATNPVTIGSPYYPALSRTYLGGSSPFVLNNPTKIGGNVWAARAPVDFTNPFECYGSVVAGDFKASEKVTIHYDRAVLAAGDSCSTAGDGGADAGASDAGEADAGGGGGGSCGSCKDCGNQACVDGACGACTSSSQCCAPLMCINGTCRVSP